MSYLLIDSPIGAASTPDEIRAWLRRLDHMAKSADAGQPQEEIARAQQRAEDYLAFATELEQEHTPARSVAADPGLYVARRLENHQELRDWWDEYGKNVKPCRLDDNLHVTVAHSTKAFDWDDDQERVAIQPEKQDYDILGPKNALVLRLYHDGLQARGNAAHAQSESDYDGYKPHLTLFYLGADHDPTDLRRLKLACRRGEMPPLHVKLQLGPEMHGPLDSDVLGAARVGRLTSQYRRREIRNALLDAVGVRYSDTEARDKKGEWTAGSDSGLGDALERAGLPRGMNITNEPFKELLSRGAWDVKAVADGPERYHVTFTPKIPAGIEQSAHDRYDGSPVFYDPALAHETDDGPRLTDPSMDRIPLQPEHGVIYRGMSYEEYEGAKANGYIQSKGAYNIGGDLQEGRTSFAFHPETAGSYAGGFAAFPWKPTFERPGYVVAVKEPEGLARDPREERLGEVGVPGRVPMSSVTAVVAVKPYEMRAGTIDLVKDRYHYDDRWDTGSGSTGSGFYAFVPVSQTKRAFDENEPRDTDGKWTTAGGDQKVPDGRHVTMSVLAAAKSGSSPLLTHVYDRKLDKPLCKRVKAENLTQVDSGNKAATCPVCAKRDPRADVPKSPRDELVEKLRDVLRMTTQDIADEMGLSTKDAEDMRDNWVENVYAKAMGLGMTEQQWRELYGEAESAALSKRARGDVSNEPRDEKGKWTAGSLGSQNIGKTAKDLDWPTTVNGYDISNEKVLTNVDTPAVLAARMKSRSMPSTLEMPGRESIRLDAVNRAYGNGAARKERIANLVIGGPGAGKSTSTADRLVEEHGAQNLDADEVKRHLPEYHDGSGAAVVHAESAFLTNGAWMDRALSNGDNLVVQKIGQDIDHTREIATRLKDEGYTVNLHYVDVPTEKQMQRVVSRFNETGRFLDPAYVQEVDSKPKKTFETLKDSPLFASVHHVNNDVPFGKAVVTKVRTDLPDAGVDPALLTPTEEQLKLALPRNLPGRMIDEPDEDALAVATLRYRAAKLKDRQARRRALRDAFLTRIGIDPKRFNENHAPAGGPDGGQFSSGDGGSGSSAPKEPKAGGKPASADAAVSAAWMIANPHGNGEIVQIAQNYLQSANMAPLQVLAQAALTPQEGRAIADSYDTAPDDPTNADTIAAYNAFHQELDAQRQAIEGAGYRFEAWDKPGQPYANSTEMMKDVRENHHEFYFKSTEGTKPNGNTTLAQNDTFRMVHDFFGHAMGGNQFGPKGETNAFLDHLQMFSPLAQRALATETVGQNAFFNFDKSNEGKAIQDRSFAEQKSFLLDRALYQPVVDRGHATQARASVAPPVSADYYFACPAHPRRVVPTSVRAFNPDQPRDEKGEWVAGAFDDAMNELLKKAGPYTPADMGRLASFAAGHDLTDRGIGISAQLRDDIAEYPTRSHGFTMDKDLLPVNTPRFMVSKDGHERSFPHGTFGAKDLLGYQRGVAQTMTTGDYIGGWFNPDDKLVYLDTSRGFDSFQPALDFAHANKQLSMYDSRPGAPEAYVTVGQRGPDGSYTPLHPAKRAMDDDDRTKALKLPGTPVTHETAAAEHAHQRQKWSATLGEKARRFAANAVARLGKGKK